MDRPSVQGEMLGYVLAKIAEVGRTGAGGVLPDMCLTCAFREGSLANLSAGTGSTALDCIMDSDNAGPFSCHHGMKDGEPTKMCVGYIAAKLAPFQFVKEMLAAMMADLAELDESAIDQITVGFDRWRAEIDRENTMDLYALGRAWAKRESKMNDD